MGDAATLARVLELLKRHGDASTSFQTLEPGYAYFFDGDDACVAYADTGSAWVSVGAPVAPASRRAEVTARFVQAAAAHGRRARFFYLPESIARLPGLAASCVGEEPYWNPRAWGESLRASRRLREQLRRARAKGVSTRVVATSELVDEGAPMRADAEQLVRRWIASRPMTELRFVVRVHPFSFPEERRYIAAEREGQLVGLAVAVPIYGRDGWFVEDVLRDPERAPNGTSELMIDAMFRLLGAEGASFVTLGLAPLAGEVGWLLRVARRYTKPLYNFGGVHAFKSRLHPRGWERIYVAYPERETGLLAFLDVLRAFASGGLVGFGFRTLVHQRVWATFLLAILLVPWTLLLATPLAAPYFPGALVQYAWVLFNLLLFALMLAQLRRYRPALDGALFALTSADAALTLAQILSFNLWVARGPHDWLFMLVGLAGPLLAALFYAGARTWLRGKPAPSHEKSASISPGPALDTRKR